MLYLFDELVSGLLEDVVELIKGKSCFPFLKELDGKEEKDREEVARLRLKVAVGVNLMIVTRNCDNIS